MAIGFGRDKHVHAPRLCGAAMAVLLCGCHRAPDPSRSEKASVVLSASGTAAPLAAAPEPAVVPTQTAQSNLCHGQSTPGFACDGPKLFRCSSPNGGAEPVAVCLDIERCDAAAGICAPSCSQGEVYIPATGPKGFIMGRGMSAFGYGPRDQDTSTGHGRADVPHRVVLTRPFCMDATEVTAAAMRQCVKEHGCRPPGQTDRWSTYRRHPDYPVNMVSYQKAKYFCEQYGKSLPTEAQWEWAATGGDDRIWPWGNEEPTCDRADFTATILVSPGGDSGCHGGGPSKVGSHPQGDRVWPSGRISDLAGNVWEWVLDNYMPYEAKDEIDPVHINQNVANYVIRGGGWNRSAKGIRSAFRAGAVLTYQVPGLGFRCVRNPKPPAS